MPPKKAGKASKLARMTDEERARYLLHRANVEEEARRRKQQLICTFMKNKLKREEAFTRINLSKINQQWRQILRQTKVKELNQDVTLLWNSFERAVDTKNQIIDEMLITLQQSEDQYAMNLQSHTEAIDKLIGLHDLRLAELHDNYIAERRQLLANHRQTSADIAYSFNFDQEVLGMVMYAATTQKFVQDSIVRGEQTICVDETKNNMVTNVERLTIERESEMSVLWQKLKRVLGDYLVTTEPRRNQYDRMKTRDEICSHEVFVCCHRVNRLYDRIEALRIRLAECKEQQKYFLYDLLEERETFVHYFWMLRKKMSINSQLDKSQVTEMTVESNKALEGLAELVSKGERILSLAAVCRKLETEKEKVMPFGIDNQGDDLPTTSNPEQDRIRFEEPLTKVSEPYEKLSNFWRRYNLVHVERSALILCHKALTEENRQLRAAVKHYLGSMSNKGQLDPRLRTAPLRKYTAIVPTAQGESRKPRPITCIEASTSIAVQHMVRNKRASYF